MNRYLSSTGRTDDRSTTHTTWHVIALVYVIAVAINYPWELAQASLFTADSHAANMLLHCFIASLGDGILVLFLFALGRVLLGRRDWFERPGMCGYAVLVGAGAVLAIVVEWVAVYHLRRWTYTDAMPLVPGVKVGLVPVLQMIVLPSLIFYLVATRVRHLGRGRLIGRRGTE